MDTRNHAECYLVPARHGQNVHMLIAVRVSASSVFDIVKSLQIQAHFLAAFSKDNGVT